MRSVPGPFHRYERFTNNLIPAATLLSPGVWSVNGCSILEGVKRSPEFRNNGWKILEDGAAGNHNINVQVAATITAVPYRCMWFVKRPLGSAVRNSLCFVFDLTTFPSNYVLFVFDTGTGATITSPTPVGAFASASSRTTYRGRGWWEAELFFTPIAGTGLWPFFGLDNAGDSYTGDTTSGLEFFAPRLGVV